MSATTTRTRRCPGRSLARLTYPPRGQFLSPTLPPAARPAVQTAEPATRSRPGSDALPASGGPAVSGAPEPGPAPPGRVRRDRVPTAPPPQRPTEQWGRGQAPLHPRWCQAPSGGRGWGAPPPPTPSESRGRSDGPGPDRRPGSPLSQARARSRRSLPFPSTAGPPARERPGGEEKRAAARRDRGPARRPAARSLTCQLSSQ